MSETISFEEYQRRAVTFRANDLPYEAQVLHMACGLWEEWTELEHVGRRDHALDELGDLAWFIANAADVVGVKLEPSYSNLQGSAHDTWMRVWIQAAAKDLKRHAAYGQPLNKKEAAWALSRCVEWLYEYVALYGFEWREVLAHNIAKLSARYPDGQFSTQASIERVDEASAAE